MMKVLVAGAGAIGLTAAYRLAGAGCEVTVADPWGPGSGCSRTNAGWVVPGMATPVPAPGVLGQAMRWLLRPDSPLSLQPSLRPSYVRFLAAMARNCRPARYERALRELTLLAESALALHDRLERSVEYEKHHAGLVQVFTSRHEHSQHARDCERMLELGGSQFEVLGRAEVREAVEGLSAQVVGGIRLPSERHVNPPRFVDALVEACRASGVEFADAWSVRLVRNGTRVLACGQGPTTREFDRYVVCAGVWTNDVIAGLGAHLPLEGGKGYGYDLEGFQPQLREAIYLTEARTALTPLSTGLRIAGTMGFTGIDESIRQRRARGVLSSGTAYFERWTPPSDARPWTGLRPMTPDGLPVIGPLDTAPNVVLATGHAMLGITLAPVTAELIAGHVVGEDRIGTSDLAATFLPRRFTRRAAPGSGGSPLDHEIGGAA